MLRRLIAAMVNGLPQKKLVCSEFLLNRKGWLDAARRCSIDWIATGRVWDGDAGADCIGLGDQAVKSGKARGVSAGCFKSCRYCFESLY